MEGGGGSQQFEIVNRWRYGIPFIDHFVAISLHFPTLTIHSNKYPLIVNRMAFKSIHRFHLSAGKVIQESVHRIAGAGHDVGTATEALWRENGKGETIADKRRWPEKDRARTAFLHLFFVHVRTIGEVERHKKYFVN